MEQHEVVKTLALQIKVLQDFHSEVMAGCDIRKGPRLYRQVPVVIGPGKTQAEIDNEALQTRVVEVALLDEALAVAVRNLLINEAVREIDLDPDDRGPWGAAIDALEAWRKR